MNLQFDPEFSPAIFLLLGADVFKTMAQPVMMQRHGRLLCYTAAMEIWFWLAIVSAVTGGVGAFTHKVAAMRNIDVHVFNVYASLLSATVLGLCTWYFADFSHFWEMATLIAIIGSGTYLLTMVLKIASLKEIDSAIFFPLYKVSGPLMAIGFGMLFFAESFSLTEWVGLLLSIMVPLLLVTRSEHTRQKNLLRGIYLLLIASVTGSISVAFYKYGTNIAENIWLLIFVGDLFLALVSIAVLWRTYKHATFTHLRTSADIKMLQLTGVAGLSQLGGGAAMVFAFATGGALGIVYTINSLYILIPIVLSVIFYQEHWNLRKVIAIILSVAALVLLK